MISGQFMGVHNALGALLALEADFDGVWVSGLEVSASMGVPDTEIVSLAQTLEICRQVTRVTAGRPVLVDADTGYGDAKNLAYAMVEFARAGVAAVCVEDKEFPKRNSFVDTRHQLTPINAFREKVHAAREAAEGHSVLLIARTESLIAGAGIDVALERAHAYADAGADAVLIHDKSSDGFEALEFARQWAGRTPLVAVPTTYFGVSYSQLLTQGFSAVIYANQALRASIRSMSQTMAAIRNDGGTHEIEHELTSVQEIFRLQGLGDARRFTSALSELK
jgi:phosphoenolpyruvate phosphomutase